MEQHEGTADLLSLMFSRNRLALGEAAFSTVRAAKVAVIGVGGVGSAVCEQMIRLGVQDVAYFARGSYEFGNINRQIPATYLTVRSGTKKIHALAQRLLEINPFCHLEHHDCDVVKDSDQLLVWLTGFRPSFIFNCVDECRAQYIVAAHARSIGVPCLIGGVIGTGLEGIVSTFATDGAATYDEIFPYIHDLDQPQRAESAESFDIQVKRQWLSRHEGALPATARQHYKDSITTPYPVLTPLPWLVASCMVLEFAKSLLSLCTPVTAPEAVLVRPLMTTFAKVNLSDGTNEYVYYPWRP